MIYLDDLISFQTLITDWTLRYYFILEVSKVFEPLVKTLKFVAKHKYFKTASRGCKKEK